jgi:hypothetical protein
LFGAEGEDIPGGLRSLLKAHCDHPAANSRKRVPEYPETHYRINTKIGLLGLELRTNADEWYESLSSGFTG